MTARPRAYLAGPDVFHQDAMRRGEDLVRRCAEHGIDGIFPFDPDEPGKDREPGIRTARSIYDEDLDLLDGCNMVIANMEPFRGPSMDVGTAFEMGYAVRAGVPVFAYSSKADQTYAERVFSIAAGDGRVEDQADMLVEDFGLTDNLMVTCSPIAILETFDAACRAARKWWDGVKG